MFTHSTPADGFFLQSFPSYLYGSSQVDACLNSHVVGGLEKSPLQEQGKEQQHCQHICILKKLLGGNEIDTEQPYLDGEAGRRGERGIDQFIIVCQAETKVNNTGWTLQDWISGLK